jgi:hypothetical protein
LDGANVVRQLRRLVDLRRDLVHDRTRLINRITDALKAYFPQVLGWFSDKEAPLFADFLKRWPTLQQAQRARPETLRVFFHAANVRRASTIEKRLEAIWQERPLHHDAAVIAPARMVVEALLPQLRAVSSSIRRFDAESVSLGVASRLRALLGVTRACWRRLANGGSAYRRLRGPEVLRRRAGHRAQRQ